MVAKVRRPLIIVGSVIVGLALLLGILVLITVRRSFPEVKGTLSLPGLEGPVEVFRDNMGVPHIYAASEHDLFMAQGFVHAQDRFWQMDFWRHIGAGRLSEMFGESQLETDQFLRTLGWARVAEQELGNASPRTLTIFQAYADGVNAYLAQRQGASLSLEYAVLGLLNPDYEPEPWLPIHTITWGKAMAWDLGGNMDLEIERAVLISKLGPRMSELFPAYPSEHPYIVPGFGDGAKVRQDQLSGLYRSLLPFPALEAIAGSISALNNLTGGGMEGIGSNNWVISGERTTTGSPILANDSHLPIQMPSIWYENGLHCQPITSECPYNMVGFSFAGVPAVIAGHNERIAWGITNLGPDVQDLFLEKINPDNPNQYLVNGQWEDMTIVEEIIQVDGAEPVPITIRYTRHGPILSDVDDEFAALADQRAAQEPNPIAISLRWTALDPGTIFEAVLAIGTAGNWDEFREALRSWDVPSQNFVYADVDGNIGYQSPGKIPIRASGDGSVPAIGWTDEYEWIGFIPFDELPTVYNPPEGYIATANNAVVSLDYPYFISSDWDRGYRAARIAEMIEAQSALSVDDMKKIHGDNHNAMGALLTPILLDLEFKDEPEIEEKLRLLSGWDFQDSMDSAPAALFNAVWHNLIVRTFADDLPPGWLPGSSNAFLVVTQLLDRPNSPWWDDLQTQVIEDRDEILRMAVEEALAELEDTLGPNLSKWTWGALHTATFVNATLGKSGIAPIEALFNRGPFPTAGGSSVVNATGWSFELDYLVRTVPSKRMIIDLSDLGNSETIHTTGQSGHAYHPHYIDMADMWRLIQYHPMFWDRVEIESAAESRLELIP